MRFDLNLAPLPLAILNAGNGARLDQGDNTAACIGPVAQHMRIGGPAQNHRPRSAQKAGMHPPFTALMVANLPPLSVFGNDLQRQTAALILI